MLVKAFISKFAIKTYNKGILGWFARLNKAEPDLAFFTPKEHGFTRKFCAMIPI
jgi:hypothetical protein